MIRVFSSACATTADLWRRGDACIFSVQSQRCHVPFKHTYVDAFLQKPRKGALENWWDFVHKCDPADIIVCLDGDDTFARTDALIIVADAYREGPHGPWEWDRPGQRPWVTYGSFHTAGRIAWQREIPASNWSRRSMQTPSHLKTFRAALAQKLDPARDLQTPDGTWWDLYRDGAVMFPLLEMAGHARTRFLPETLVDYCWESSDEAAHRHDEGYTTRVRRAVHDVRNLPPREPLASLEF